MSDLRDAVALLSRAVELLASCCAESTTEVTMLARDARAIAQTVNGVAGKSDEL